MATITSWDAEIGSDVRVVWDNAFSITGLPRPVSFQFVNLSHTGQHDHATLSRVRRHAMKEIGLQRRKPKKRRHVSIQLEVVDASALSIGGPNGDSGFASPALLSPMPAIGGGSIHSFFHLPIELDEIGKGLLANIWSSDYTISSQVAHRPDWFTTGIADAATCYQILANSELYLQVLRSEHRLGSMPETAISVYYHQRAVTLHRRRVANVAKSKVTEAMLGTAASLKQYAELAEAVEWWLQQRKGVIELARAFEGGYDALDRNRPLRAACSWAELKGAFMLDFSCVMPLPQW